METATHNHKHGRVVDIAPDGDLLLIVGKEEVRLRVYSQCLKTASSVFRAMFGPHWIEGQNISPESPTEVVLCEDDADAMDIICCVIHHRTALVPERLTGTQILKVAIEVDKYDLTSAFRWVSPEWLKPLTTKDDMVLTGHLLAAAFLLNDSDAFMALIMKLIVNYGVSYLSLCKDPLISQVLPTEVFLLLEERRTRFRAQIYYLLLDEQRDFCQHCGWGKARNKEVRRLLEEWYPMAMYEVRLTEIVTEIEALPTEDGKRCGYHNMVHEKVSKEYVDQRLLPMKRIAGMSIDFVRDLRNGTAEISNHYLSTSHQ